MTSSAYMTGIRGRVAPYIASAAITVFAVSSQYRDLSREDDRPIAQAPAAQAIWERASVCRRTLQLVQWDPAAPPELTLTDVIRGSRQELAVSQDAAPLLD